ncbi:MAG: ATP-binding protein, partial [Bryobacteraceae bacterium]
SDRTGGLFVRTRDRMPLEPGDQVDVAGFPSSVDERAALVDATFHRTAGGKPPAPLPLTAGEALVGEHDSALVEIEGELGAISPVGNDKVLVLHQAGTTFTARVRAADPEVKSLREGSRVRLTGICLVQYDLFGNPLALNLRLRSGRDIAVTRRASWLTTGRALSILGFLAIAIVLALTWIAILRRRVQKQTEIIRTTLESTGDGILVADSRRIPMAYNQRFVEMWRIPKPVLNARDEQSLLKFTLSQVKDPDGYLAKVDSLYDNGEAQADDVFEFSDGRVIEYHSEPLRIGGTPRGRVWGFRDITDRKRAEEKILRYSNDLAKANEELKRFTYIASHDLRAPLISLKGFSAELRESLDTIRQPVENALPAMGDSEREAVRDAIRVGIPEALDFIESSATRMDHLINALLKLSRLGHREFRMEELNMRELVQLTVDALAHQIETRGAEMKIGELPVAVADRTAVEQIFGNLLNNAVVYLDGKRTGKIEVYARETYDELVYYVRDNGRGIAADDMDKVFAPFRRAGHQDVPGEGMGLAYVQVLVNRLGGQIRCESEAGAGTTFSFSLPKSKEKINSHG